MQQIQMKSFDEIKNQTIEEKKEIIIKHIKTYFKDKDEYTLYDLDEFIKDIEYFAMDKIDFKYPVKRDGDYKFFKVRVAIGNYYDTEKQEPSHIYVYIVDKVLKIGHYEPFETYYYFEFI